MIKQAKTASADVLHPPVAQYSHALIAPAGSELLYISGQVGIRRDGTTPSSLAEQAEQTLLNVRAILEANGLSFADVIKMNTYVVAGQSIAEIRAVRAKLLGDARPCSTAVFVSALANPEWLIEIEAVAVKGPT